LLVLLSFLISRLIIRSGLRISHSKVFSSKVPRRLKMRGEQALFNLEIKKKRDQALIPISTIQKFPALLR